MLDLEQDEGKLNIEHLKHCLIEKTERTLLRVPASTMSVHLSCCSHTTSPHPLQENSSEGGQDPSRHNGSSHCNLGDGGYQLAHTSEIGLYRTPTPSIVYIGCRKSSVDTISKKTCSYSVNLSLKSPQRHSLVSIVVALKQVPVGHSPSFHGPGDQGWFTEHV